MVCEALASAHVDGGHMDFATAVKRNLTTSAYAQFSGRASRSEYWWFFLFTLLAQSAATVVDVAIGADLFANLLTIAFFIPNLALIARRLHHQQRLAASPGDAAERAAGRRRADERVRMARQLLQLYWLIRPGNTGANAHGEPGA